MNPSAGRPFIKVPLQHPIPGSDGAIISVVKARPWTQDEWRQIKRKNLGTQRRGIAALRVATGLTWKEVNSLDQSDITGIAVALEAAFFRD